MPGGAKPPGMAKVQRIRAAAGAQAAADAAEAAKVEPTKTTSRGVDLNAPETQQQILEPKPVIVTVAGAEIMLHPLPAKVARQFVGLVMQILSEMQVRSSVPTSIVSRMSGVLIENAELTRKFSGYAARATFPTNVIPTAEQIVAEQQRIDENATFTELIVMFTHIAEMNNALGVLAGKK